MASRSAGGTAQWALSGCDRPGLQKVALDRSGEDRVLTGGLAASRAAAKSIESGTSAGQIAQRRRRSHQVTVEHDEFAGRGHVDLFHDLPVGPVLRRRPGQWVRCDSHGSGVTATVDPDLFVVQPVEQPTCSVRGRVEFTATVDVVLVEARPDGVIPRLSYLVAGCHEQSSTAPPAACCTASASSLVGATTCHCRPWTRQLPARWNAKAVVPGKTCSSKRPVGEA